MTAARRPGCRICGARDHQTKCHDGRLVRAAILEVSRQRDPLQIASSSWLLNRRSRTRVREGRSRNV